MIKRDRIIYGISTGLLSLLMLMSAGMYFFNYSAVSEVFSSLGYPTYIIYPLAVAKILGVLVLWFSPSRRLKEWAYAGFFFDFTLALSGHLIAEDGAWSTALVALVLLGLSYVFGRRTETAGIATT